MLNYRNIPTLLLMLLVTTVSFSQNTEKTLVRAFNLQGKNSVVLDLKGDIEVENWSKDYLRIQMTTNLENGSSAMLKSLIMAGRYNLKGRSTTDGFEITMPNIEKTIKVKGQELVERCSYIIFAPKNVSVEQLNQASVSVEVPLSEF